MLNLKPQNNENQGLELRDFNFNIENLKHILRTSRVSQWFSHWYNSSASEHIRGDTWCSMLYLLHVATAGYNVSDAGVMEGYTQLHNQ